MISRPDLIDMEVLSRQSNRENLEQAFEIAESLGVTSLLDAEGETVDLNEQTDQLTLCSFSVEQSWLYLENFTLW